MREVGRQNKPRGIGEIAPTRSWENTEDSYQQHMGISNTWGESLIKTCGLNICVNQEPRERVLEWTCRDRDIENILSSSEEPGHVKRSYLINENENYSKRERLFRIWKDKMRILYPHFPASKMKYLLKERDNPYLVTWYSFIWADFHVTEMIRNLNGVGSFSLRTALENGLIKTA